MNTILARDSARDLGRSAVRGGAMTIGGQLVRACVLAASLVVLARLLDPREFGYVAMVVALVGVGEIFREAGLAKAAVQTARLTTGQRDNLFWISTGLGIAVGAFVFLLAPTVAAFYDEPALVEVTRWLALTFALNGLGAQFRASLQRELRFSVIAAADVAGPVLGLVAAIVIAVSGGGHWSIVGQQLTVAVVVNLGLMAVAGWLPGIPQRNEPMRDLIRYGTHLLGTQVLGYAASNADTIVIGFRFGAVFAGLYSRVLQIARLPIAQLNWPAAQVALPVLARLQSEPERFMAFLLRGQVVLLHLIVPVLTLAGVFAAPVIEVVLGKEWLRGSTAFAILAIGSVLQMAAFSSTWMFMALGRTREQLHATLATRPIAVVAVVVGSFWGMEGVAVGFGVAQALFWPVNLWWAGRVSGLPVMSLFTDACRVLLAHGLAGAIAGAVVYGLNIAQPWLALSAGVAVAGCVLVLEALIWPSLRRDARAVMATVGLLRRRPPGNGHPAPSKPLALETRA